MPNTSIPNGLVCGRLAKEGSLLLPHTLWADISAMNSRDGKSSFIKGSNKKGICGMNVPI
jgi:hypothetical protein